MDNYDRRLDFMRLTEKQRFERLFDRLNILAENRVADTKLLADMRTDLEFLKLEMEGINHRKGDTLTTNEKINLQLNKRFDTWVWFRDKVLPQIVTIILLAVLALAFGVKPS